MTPSARTTTAIFLSVRDKATRLPGKVFAEIQGKPVIEHLIDRLKAARLPNFLVMTTSTHADDTRLVEVAARSQIASFRGSEQDKLQRYLDAGEKYGVDFAAVVDGDDFFCDPVFIDRVIEAYATTGADYITCRDLPVGVTPFGVRIAAIRRVCAAKTQSDTEVWGGYFQTGAFKTLALDVEARYRHPEWRMTLDYPEDLAFFTAIFERLYRPGRIFSFDEIVELLSAHPEIVALNERVQTLYAQHLRRAAPVSLKRRIPREEDTRIKRGRSAE